MSLAVSLDDVVAARDRIWGHVRRTPLKFFPDLGLHLKMEHVQGTGSFKLRGATNVVRGLRPKGVVTGSSGNHGAALTQAALNGGVDHAVVVMAEGKVLCEGSADEVMTNEHVIEAYLGTGLKNRPRAGAEAAS